MNYTINTRKLHVFILIHIQKLETLVEIRSHFGKKLYRKITISKFKQLKSFKNICIIKTLTLKIYFF